MNPHNDARPIYWPAYWVSQDEARALFEARGDHMRRALIERWVPAEQPTANAECRPARDNAN